MTRRNLTHRSSMMIPAAMLLFVCSSAAAQDPLQTLADRLIQMRGQVDELQNELTIKREEHKNRMAYLTAQVAELEANRDREQLRLRQLESDLEKMRTELAEAGDTSETLSPVVLTHLGKLREQVRGGFPFKVGERIAELDEIEAQLNSGVVSAQRAFNRLWAFFEDELRITRENAIYTQAINLRGDNVLVDVAKLGNAMMFFRTRDLQYGKAVRTDAGWRFELLNTAVEQEQVARLFDSLRKQIRQGYFELPNTLPEPVEVSS
jgi:chromosome segregation ATPase